MQHDIHSRGHTPAEDCSFLTPSKVRACLTCTGREMASTGGSQQDGQHTAGLCKNVQPSDTTCQVCTSRSRSKSQKEAHTSGRRRHTRAAAACLVRRALCRAAHSKLVAVELANDDCTRCAQLCRDCGVIGRHVVAEHLRACSGPEALGADVVLWQGVCSVRGCAVW
jgi:hypothetical protein